MAKNKLKKFTDLDGFQNVYQNFDYLKPVLIGAQGVEVALKGTWAEKHFGNNNPIVLELACGMGHYTVALAQKYHNKNFIGIDIKGARIWQGARIGLDKNILNAAFVRTRIELIESFFEKQEVDEIWITFPDPFLKKSRASNRLTSPGFLQKYRNILKKGGFIHLKTDSQELYEYSHEIFAEDEQVKVWYKNNDIYSDVLDIEELEIKTYYEQKHLKKGKTITYTRFSIS